MPPTAAMFARSSGPFYPRGGRISRQVPPGAAGSPYPRREMTRTASNQVAADLRGAPHPGDSPPVGRTHVTTTEPRHPGLQDPGQQDGGVGTTVVLDTCVLLADPDSLYAFGDADIVIPLTVIEELDGHKNRLDDVGRAARAVVRDLERLRVESRGDFREPVDLPTGGTLRVAINGLVLETIAAHGLNPDKADNRILAAALGLTRDSGAGR